MSAHLVSCSHREDLSRFALCQFPMIECNWDQITPSPSLLSSLWSLLTWLQLNSDTLATISWVVCDCSQTDSEIYWVLMCEPQNAAHYMCTGIVWGYFIYLLTVFCGVVYVCVRAFWELLSREKRTRCAKRFPNLIQEICKSSANYCCLFLFSPPFSSLKLVFWGNRSQMENIRCNHFHLLALLLSLRGDTLSPSDISSQWTVTENSSITWDEELWQPESGRNLVIW